MGVSLQTCKQAGKHEWKHIMPTIQKNQKCLFSDKVVLMMFCDLNGQVLNHCQE